MTLRGLIEAVGNGAFLMDVLSPEHEITAYEAFSGSLDAAKRLHDALLPGKSFGVGDMRAGVYTENGYLSEQVEGDNPARAWLLAILRAIEGGQE